MGAMLTVFVLATAYIGRRLFGDPNGILTQVGARAMSYFDKLEERDEKRDTFCEAHTVGMSELVHQGEASQHIHECESQCLKELCALHRDSDAVFATKRIDASAADFARAELLLLETRTGLADHDKASLAKTYERIIRREEHVKPK